MKKYFSFQPFLLSKVKKKHLSLFIKYVPLLWIFYYK